MDHALGIVGTHVDNYYWWKDNIHDQDHLLVTNSGLQYFTLKLQKNSILYKKFQKNKYYTSFQFFFLCIFLIGGNLVSKYEQLLILRGINASTLNQM